MDPDAGEIDRAVWGSSHPYGRPVGTREVAQATKAEACAFIDRYYTPKRAILVIAGNIDPDAIQPRIGRRFGPISRTSDAPKFLDPIAPARLAGTRSKHSGDVEHPTAVIVLPAPPWGSPDEAVHDATLAAARGELVALDDRTDWILDVGVGYGGDSYQRTTLIVVEVKDAARLDDAVGAALRAAQGVLADEDHDGNADDDDDPDDRAVAHQLAALRGRMQTQTITANDRFAGKGDAIADYLTFTDQFDFAFARMRATDFAAAEVTEADAGLTTPEAVVTLSIGPEPVEPSDAAPDAGVAEVADGGTAAPAAAPAAAPTIVETIVIELGGAAPGDGQIYVRVRGLPTIYTISRYTSDRLRGEASLFQEPEPGAAPEEGAEDPASCELF